MNKTKILLFDIETSPNVGYTWGKYEQNVIEFTEDWFIMSFAYKWLGDKTTKVKSLADYKGYNKNKKDDIKLVLDLWKLFNEADVIIAHNGDSFDIKKANARFVIHNLAPPSPYKTVDTKKVAKKYFKFDSNKLDDLGKYLNVGRKIKHDGFDMWKDCLAGNKKAWVNMKKYNKQDVELLEDVYEAMKPWMTNHPNVNILDGITHACPICGGEHLQKRGFNITKTGKVQRYQCSDCGGWSNGKTVRVVEIK